MTQGVTDMNAMPLGRLIVGRLRAGLLALRGASVGEKVGIDAGCVFSRPGGIVLGRRVSLEKDIYAKLVLPQARLSIGEYTFIGRGSEFDVMQEVSLGAHTLVAPRCFITDHAHGIAPGARIDEQPCVPAPVRIGSDVWLGYGVVVLPGVTIGDGAVVGANSVVTKDVAPLSVVAGAPAREIRRR